ncbi:MAG: hypothetical protein AVDCRST_MAG44-817 [uncultured Sphingomonas sp.]|uniref:Heavy-metal-associated domain-containing protein n=1 Tax=uncultured Sphingomonas sp. TaxID=158754 RepID=A0A6J4SN55_9SPHN|nr:MAG: hypothetical protein AVDCRST_MAG44-817 [uncultured Sphingomonas sp.]
MLRRRFVVPFLVVLALVGFSGAVYAQLESAERGILPIDSSGTLEVTGVHVDVGGPDSQSARFAGWRIAQREGFRKLWASVRKAPIDQAPNLPDSTLDQIVSSINVEREQIGPNRYIADLGLLFDRARAAAFLGVEGGQVRRSAPMLLIPITVSGGAETSVELRNGWQRAWAQFRTSSSAIDYVRVSGLASDPMLVNAAQTQRPGRGWWRNLVDLYGAADILVAEVQVQRLYPGGPARARFIGRHGPDNEIVGGFTLTAANSEGMPRMMAEGVRRIDQLFANALAGGMLVRDPSLDLPPPPPVPVTIAEEPTRTPSAGQQSGRSANAYQVQISSGGDVAVYNFAMAHLRTLGGVESAAPQQINPGGTSYVLVTYRGDIGALAAALGGRGWIVEQSGTVVRIRSGSNRPPPLPPPPPPQPPPAPPPAQQPVVNQSGSREE